MRSEPCHDGDHRQRLGTAGDRGLRIPGPLWLWGALATVLAMSITRAITDNDDLTSSGTMSVAIRTAAPIAMAGLGGLYAERSGTVNIGLEGMMILGTVVGGWWGWEYGPWGALLGGAVGGLFGGLLLAVVTTTFGVNHIVAGFAINILAPGIARFMSTTLFVGEQGGSLTNSPGVTGDIGEFTMPFLAGGTFFGNETAGRARTHRRLELVRRVRRRRHAPGSRRGSPLRRARRRRPVRRQRVPALAHALRTAPPLGG